MGAEIRQENMHSGLNITLQNPQQAIESDQNIWYVYRVETRCVRIFLTHLLESRLRGPLSVLKHTEDCVPGVLVVHLNTREL
jgi:hypothetical protein